MTRHHGANKTLETNRLPVGSAKAEPGSAAAVTPPACASRLAGAAPAPSFRCCQSAPPAVGGSALTLAPEMRPATKVEIVGARIVEVLRSSRFDHMTSSGLPECMYFLRVAAGVFQISAPQTSICFVDADGLVRADESSSFEGSRIEDVLLGRVLPVLKVIIENGRCFGPGWNCDDDEKEFFTLSTIPVEQIRPLCIPYWGEREQTPLSP